ncbi:hypothetical protein ACFLSX_04115 [Calditrichota bacterium]
MNNEITEIEFPETYRILPQSINIFVNRILLNPEQNYRLNQENTKILFFTPLASGDTIRTQYQILPVLLKRKYSFFKIDTLKTVSGDKDSVQVLRQAPTNPFANVGGSLKKSGSIVRGVKIGSNRDLTLNSGLNLQLSGQLTEDIEIVAALTDESTPIQPEGNTQTLREVDKVFIDFSSPWVRGTLGDFNLHYRNSSFAKISRKLQGITLLGNYQTYQLGATVGTTRGFFHHIEFIGQEANQGPYQLTGKNGENAIIVLAGTERIWINGEKLTRGENNDYIIEYGNGQVTFTNRRLITSESRIEIDFEYYPALQKYTRNVHSGLTTGSFGNNDFNYTIKYYHEADDPERLLEAEGILSDTEKDVLKNAGDDPFSAYTDGARFVGDSLGYYIKIDTVINSDAYSYYKFVDKNNGNYNVSFSLVGKDKGDYKQGILGYKWAGIGKGTYLPVKLLPLPSKQQITDIQLEYNPSNKIKITSEYAISAFDQNTLSSLEDGNNTGQALQLSTDIKPLPLNFFNTDLGKIDFAASGRMIEENFSPVDRINQPDFRKYWNVLDNNQLSAEEQSLELNSKYYPSKWLTMSGNFGLLERINFNSSRYKGSLDWDKENWFRGVLSQEHVESNQEQTKNNWLRQKAKIQKDVGYLQPGINVDHELRKSFSHSGKGGFDFVEVDGRLGLINHQYLSGYIAYSQREDKVFDPNQDGKKINQATTQTKQFRLNLSEWNNLSGSFELILRKKNYTPFFENIKVENLKLQYVDAQLQDTVWQDRATNLAELILNNHQWNKALDVRWQYRISTEQLALRRKIYIDVGEGRGNIRYDEQLQEYIPDPDGNLVLYIVPSGNFEPITNLQTALRLNLDPLKYWKKPKSQVQKLLTVLNSESYFRVEEESKEKDVSQIYFLNLSKFQGDQTLHGSMVFNEDLHILRRNRDISFRLRYRYRDDKFNQFLDPNENEDRLNIEQGIRASYKIVNKLKAQTELQQKFITRNSEANSSRNRDIKSLIIDQNLSYRPDLRWEFGLDSELGFEKDIIPERNINLRYGRLLSRVNYALLKKGRISAEYEYLDVKMIDNPNELVVPFEMARGKKEGLNQRWQLRGEYTVAENVVFTLFYTGRDDANFDKIIHTGQAEIRAYF